MFKKSAKILGWAGLMFFLVFFIVGCRETAPTTAKSDLTPNKAAELIYHDLTFHGIGVDKVNVTSCIFTDLNTAVVEVTYLTVDGRNVSQKVPIVKENGQWLIEDHSH